MSLANLALGSRLALSSLFACLAAILWDFVLPAVALRVSMNFVLDNSVDTSLFRRVMAVLYSSSVIRPFVYKSEILAALSAGPSIILFRFRRFLFALYFLFLLPDIVVLLDVENWNLTFFSLGISVPVIDSSCLFNFSNSCLF